MNVSMSQVVIDLDTNVGTIQKMVSFYTLITASLLLISAKLQDIIGKRKTILLLFFIFLLLIPRLHLLFSIGAVYNTWTYAAQEDKRRIDILCR